MKLRSDSFAASISSVQRDELFALLAGGKSCEAGADWVKERSRKRPSAQAVSAWYKGEFRQRRIDTAKAVAVIAEANCPGDYDDRARRAIGQAKFLAALEDLAPKEVALFEKNELNRQKLDLDRQRLALDTERLKLAQLDAAKAALAHVKELRAIASDTSATDAQKLERARLRLFGDGAAVASLADLDQRQHGKGPTS